MAKQSQTHTATVHPKDAWFSIFMPHGVQHGDTLKGFAASAGNVTAKACVMLGPEDFNKMKQGDVLVAVTTTPAWTPLFTMAFRCCDRHRRTVESQFHRRARIWNSCSAGNGQRDPPHSGWSDCHRRRRRRDGGVEIN